MEVISAERTALQWNLVWNHTAIRRFLEKQKPRISLHGHIHESARLMGSWKDRVGETWCFGGAHDGFELALLRFDTECPEDASRELL